MNRPGVHYSFSNFMKLTSQNSLSIFVFWISTFCGPFAIGAKDETLLCDGLTPEVAALTTQSHYDKNAAAYFNSNMRTSHAVETERDYFLSSLPGRNRLKRILDVGAGPGRDSLHFFSLGHETVSTDPSLEMTKIATKNLGYPALQLAIKDFTFKEEFDGIWAMAVLHHLPVSELKSSFIKLRDALRGDGVIHASFIMGVGTEDIPEIDREGRFWSRVSPLTLLRIIDEVEGLKVTNIHRQKDDYHKEKAPSNSLYFLNIYLQKTDSKK